MKTDTLVAQFPGLMHEQMSRYGIACGEGWYQILLNLFTALAVLEPRPVIVQVKEKFGGLRVYLDGGGEEAAALIREAENLASETCEDCGAPGRLRMDRPWIATLCDHHAAHPNVELTP
jgi:hypothetical protein